MQTTKTTATSTRQSREAQRNAKAERAYKSLRYEGKSRYNDMMDVFSVASESQQGVRYTVTVDLVTGHSHCDCPAGIHSRRCVHQQAADRYMANRAAALIKATDKAVQAQMADEQAARDTSARRVRPFSLMA